MSNTTLAMRSRLQCCAMRNGRSSIRLARAAPGPIQHQSGRAYTSVPPSWNFIWRRNESHVGGGIVCADVPNLKKGPARPLQRRLETKKIRTIFCA
eukprot:IDg5996t1